MKPTDVYCRQCGSRPGEKCTTKKGEPTSPHAKREREARASAPPAPVATPNPARDRSEDAPDPPTVAEVALEDARRVLRNRTFGIADPTLDPTDVLAELVGEIDSVLDGWHSPEQWDERAQEHENELQDLRRQLESAVAERNLHAGRDELSGGKLEQTEAERDAARQELGAALEDAVRMRDRICELERAARATTGVPFVDVGLSDLADDARKSQWLNFLAVLGELQRSALGRLSDVRKDRGVIFTVRP